MSKKSAPEKYVAVDITDLKEGDRVVLDFKPSGPKMGTITKVDTVIIPPKVGSNIYQEGFTETTISALSDNNSPYEITETIVQKITRNTK